MYFHDTHHCDVVVIATRYITSNCPTDKVEGFYITDMTG